MGSTAPLRLTYVAGSFPPSTGYGGPTASSYELCRHLIERGVAVRVLAINAEADGGRLPVASNQWTSYEGVAVFYADRIGRTHVAPRLYTSPGGIFGSTDVAHLSGGFSLLVPVVSFWSAIRRFPIVFSPRGSLLSAALASKSGRKRIFNAAVGRLCYPRFAAWHATSEDEAAAVRRWAGSLPVAVIPNGVAIPEQRSFPLPRAAGGSEKRYLIYLGRIHPYKQIEMIIDGFARGAAGAPIELWIAGSGDAAYLGELERFAARSAAAPRIRFVGYADGPERSALLAHAEGLLLGSKSENFGLAAAEALARGTPCVVTRSAPWAGLERERCGFWVEPSAEGLASGIRSLLALTADERRAMGARGRSWMERDFSWKEIARRTHDLYESVRDRP